MKFSEACSESCPARYRFCDDNRIVVATTKVSTLAASLRLLAMLVVGVVFASAAILIGLGEFAVAAGWIAGALCYILWVWLRIGRMTPEATKSHATREDPSRTASDLVVVLACLASLGIVILVLVKASHAAGPEKIYLAAVALLSVAVSWVLIHTLYTLRYASIYYRSEGRGIDFNQSEDPDYRDFAYVSFVLGMTYQVADTSLRNREFRMTVLRHGLLSYLFGAVILASVINLISGLGG